MSITRIKNTRLGSDLPELAIKPKLSFPKYRTRVWLNLNLLLGLRNVQIQGLKIPDLVQIYLNPLLRQNWVFQNTGLGSDSIYIFKLVWRGADDVLRVLRTLLGQRPRVLSLLLLRLLRPSVSVIYCGIPTRPTELVWLRHRYVNNIINLFINIL